MDKLNKLTSTVLKNSQIPLNVAKNTYNYTYNIFPKSINTVKSGMESGEWVAGKRKYSTIKTFLTKILCGAKNLKKKTSPTELPFVLSAINLPNPIAGSILIAFAIGCILISPHFIKKIIAGEINISTLKKQLSNLGKENFIQKEVKSKLSTKA